MYIYNYDKKTKEYLGYEVAEKDPEETKKQGKFIPLVPANATLEKVPPFHAENQTVIWEENIWKVVPDYRKNFLKVDNDLNVYEITTFGVQTGYIVVDKATGEDIKINKDWYKIVNDEVVKKSKEEYEKEQEEKRKEQFEKEFFNTSLGWIRRAVTMKDGSHKDFLSDLLPTISMAVSVGQEVKIIAYDKPPFDKDITDWTKYQHNEIVTQKFIQECFQQLQADFGVVNQ